MRPTHYRKLDVLRAFAVLVVFFEHVIGALAPDSWVTNTILTPIGRFGVILFFFHTSFVLTQSIEAGGTEEPLWIHRFYIRRIFRIYPLAVTFVLLGIATRIPVWNGQPAPLTLRTIVSNLFLFQNLVHAWPIVSPLWSLPIEVEMYVLLPFIFMLLGRAHWQKAILLLTASAAVTAGLCYRFTGHLNLLAFTGCFLAGCTSYKISRSVSARWPAYVWPVFLVAITAAGIAFTQKIAVEWGLCFGIALLFPALRDMPASRFTAAATWTAKYSYGIYLSHEFARVLCFDLAGGYLRYTVVKFLAAMLATAAASVATYHMIEEPFIRLGKRLSSRVKGRTANATAAAV